LHTCVVCRSRDFYGFGDFEDVVTVFFFFFFFFFFLFFFFFSTHDNDIKKPKGGRGGDESA